MKFNLIGTSELLTYSTILENIITTNLSLQGEMKEAVDSGHCEVSELKHIFSKSENAAAQADEAYTLIQKELDLRMKRDLKVKLGIVTTKNLIKQLDDFVRNKNKDNQEKYDVENAKAVAEQMKVVKSEEDDISE